MNTIELLEILLISKYNQNLIEQNDNIDLTYFESDIAKNYFVESLQIVFPFYFSGQEYNFNELDFNEKYSIALKSIRYKYKF